MDLGPSQSFTGIPSSDGREFPSARPTTVAVGIDVAEERKGIDLVALDTNRALLTSAGRLTVEDVARMVLTGIRPSIVCIDSPSGWSHSGKSRAAERELRQFGINAFSTGPDPGPHPFYCWMRVGFSIYEALVSTFPLFRCKRRSKSVARAA